VTCDRDVNVSIRRERRGERSSVYPKRPPAASKPIGASLGAGPGAPDSARTISALKEGSLKSSKCIGTSPIKALKVRRIILNVISNREVPIKGQTSFSSLVGMSAADHIKYV